jgi:hypothetical protein
MRRLQKAGPIDFNNPVIIANTSIRRPATPGLFTQDRFISSGHTEYITTLGVWQAKSHLAGTRDGRFDSNRDVGSTMLPNLIIRNYYDADLATATWLSSEK